MGDRTRVRRLVAAGLIDSFGLAFGWTVFNLHAIDRGGLGAVALFNAAMLIGVALSAPVAGLLAKHLSARKLLRTTSIVEAVFRVGVFVLSLNDALTPLIALAVVVMNVVAWTGYAGMRAEVTALDRRAGAVTWYMVGIVAVEAVGAATAALLPTDSQGVVGGLLLVAVIAFYAAALIPTFVVAGAAVVVRGADVPSLKRIGRRVRPLLGGGGIMLLGSGPTLLAVGLVAELHGTKWIGAAAACFLAGALLAPMAVARVDRLQLPARVVWPLWGAGMIVGWVAAPWHVAGVLVAQLLSGLCLASFEGSMDAAVASDPDSSHITAALAWSAAVRALGSATAVALTPTVIEYVDIGPAAGALGGFLVIASLASAFFVILGGKKTRVLRSSPPLRAVEERLEASTLAG